jgi:hypothetical protein
VCLTLVDENVFSESTSKPGFTFAVHCAPCEAALALSTRRVQCATDDLAHHRDIDAFTYLNNWPDELVAKHFWRRSGEQALRLVNIGAANSRRMNFDD